jgi:hypothetical protein
MKMTPVCLRVSGRAKYGSENPASDYDAVSAYFGVKLDIQLEVTIY